MLYLEQIIVDHAMRDCDVVIIGAGGKQWIPLVILNISDSVGVVPQHLIRHGGQVQVKPLNLLIIGSYQQIVSSCDQ